MISTLLCMKSNPPPLFTKIPWVYTNYYRPVKNKTEIKNTSEITATSEQPNSDLVSNNMRLNHFRDPDFQSLLLSRVFQRSKEFQELQAVLTPKMLIRKSYSAVWKSQPSGVQVQRELMDPKARLTREGQNLVSKNECKCKRGVRECHGRLVVMPSHRIGWHTPDQACSANK